MAEHTPTPQDVENLITAAKTLIVQWDEARSFMPSWSDPFVGGAIMRLMKAIAKVEGEETDDA